MNEGKCSEMISHNKPQCVFLENNCIGMCLNCCGIHEAQLMELPEMIHVRACTSGTAPENLSLSLKSSCFVVVFCVILRKPNCKLMWKDILCVRKLRDAFNHFLC